MFFPWADLLPESIELVALEPPGRASRSAERSFDHIQTLIEILTPAFASQQDKIPFGFFGHSLGALVVFELARSLRREQAQQPCALWISGRRAPHLPSWNPIDPNGSDHELMERMEGSGLNLSALAPAVRDLLLPVLRSDLSLAASYRFCDEAPLISHLTVLGGVDDRLVSESELQDWFIHTTGPRKLFMFPGGHDYLDQSQPVIADIIVSTVRLLASAKK